MILLPKKIPTRIHYFYENILRNDLLLKLNCLNAMEIPRFNTVILFTNNISRNNIKNTSLALEIISGQKALYTMPSNSGNQHFLKFKQAQSVSQKTEKNATYGARKQAKQRKKKSSRKGFAPNSVLTYTLGAFIMCSLRSRNMYNFLEKILSFLLFSKKDKEKIVSNSSNHFRFTRSIHGSEIQLNLHNLERIAPEIQNHFELFNGFPFSIQIKVTTSAKNEKDTLLLWEGLEQKEIV